MTEKVPPSARTRLHIVMRDEMPAESVKLRPERSANTSQPGSGRHPGRYERVRSGGHVEFPRKRNRDSAVRGPLVRRCEWLFHGGDSNLALEISGQPRRLPLGVEHSNDG